MNFMPAGPEGVELEDAEMQGIMPRAISQVLLSCTWRAGSMGHSDPSMESPAGAKTASARFEGQAVSRQPPISRVLQHQRHNNPWLRLQGTLPNLLTVQYSSAATPQWCLQVFRELKRSATQFNVGVSYVEIYNEGFRDLLQPETKMSTISISESKK